MLIEDIKNIIDDLNTGFTCGYGNVSPTLQEGIALREIGGQGNQLGIEKPIFIVIVEGVDYLRASNVINQIYNHFLSINNQIIPYGTIIKTDGIQYPMFAQMNFERHVLVVNIPFVISRN